MTCQRHWISRQAFAMLHSRTNSAQASMSIVELASQLNVTHCTCLFADLLRLLLSFCTSSSGGLKHSCTRPSTVLQPMTAFFSGMSSTSLIAMTVRCWPTSRQPASSHFECSTCIRNYTTTCCKGRHHIPLLLCWQCHSTILLQFNCASMQWGDMSSCSSACKQEAIKRTTLIMHV